MMQSYGDFFYALIPMMGYFIYQKEGIPKDWMRLPPYNEMFTPKIKLRLDG